MALQRDKITANAEKLVAKGRVEQAIKEYERLLEENPSDVNTLNRIGDLWVRLERSDEAVKVFRKIADHYARDGFFLKAIAIFKKINKLDPSKLDIYARLAELYAKQGLAMEAKSQYMVLADYYLKHSDIPSAIGIYQSICELDPNAVNAHLRLADLYSQNQQTAEALREYDRVGRMLLKRKSTTEAMQVFRKAMKIDAGNADFAESVVTALLEDKDYDSAIGLVQSALESNKENPRLIVQLARLQLLQGDAAASRATLENGLRSNPSDVAIREGLTDAWIREGAIEQALDLVQPLIAVVGVRPEGRLAIDLLHRILRSEPRNILALEKLAGAYQRLGDDENAADAWSRLASANIDRSDYASAEQILSELSRRHPDNTQYRERLAVARMGGSSSKAGEPEPVEDVQLLPDEEFDLPGAPDADAADVAIPADSLGETVDLPEAAAEPSSDLPDLEEEIELELEFDVADTIASQLARFPSVPAGELPEAGGAAEPPFVAPAEMRAMDEENARAAEDRAFADEHVTEAEVFAKYGLIDKAVDHLRAAIERVPEHRPSYDRLLAIFLSEGDAESAALTAESYMSLLREAGDFLKAEEIERELASRGWLRAAAEVAPPLEPEAEELLPDSMPEIAFSAATDAVSDITIPDDSRDVGAGSSEEAPVAPGHPEEIEFEFDLGEMGDLPDVSLEAMGDEQLPPVDLVDETPLEFADLEPQDAFGEWLETDSPPEEGRDTATSASVSAEAEEPLHTAEEPPLEFEDIEDEALAALELEVSGEMAGGDVDAAQPIERTEESEDQLHASAAADPGDAGIDTGTPQEFGFESLAGEKQQEELFFGASELPAGMADDLPEQSSLSGADADSALEGLDSAPAPESPAQGHELDALDPSQVFPDQPSTDPASVAEQPRPEFEEPLEQRSAEPDYTPWAAPDPDSEAGVHFASIGPNVEDLGELDFYIEQELYEEADNKLRALVAQFPNHRELRGRAERLHSARIRGAAAQEAAVPPPSSSGSVGYPDSADRDLEPGPTPPAAVRVDPAAVDSPEMQVSDEEDLFSAEDDFFDLAAELEDELSEDAAATLAAGDEEQSLEQIFREFKKGVEQQLDSEDYDTHYNLGIAYKEMGLIDEAIGEFQLASKDPKRAIDGCSMLGLCFLEKGMPQLAIKWYSKGLENPEISEEEHLGLLYDLGHAYLEVGDTDNAHKAFVEVYGINSKYRDVVGRIKQLEEVRRLQ